MFILASLNNLLGVILSYNIQYFFFVDLEVCKDNVCHKE